MPVSGMARPLASWLASRGIDNPDVEVFDTRSPRGRILRARRSMKKDDSICRVPKQALISEAVADSHPVVKELSNAFELSATDKMVLFIALQKSSAEWEPYLGCFPVLHTPLQFTQEERKLLDGTTLGAFSDMVEEQELVGKYQAFCENEAFSKIVSSETFCWAFANYWSRVLQVPPDEVVIVPLIDFANHDPKQPNAYWERRGDDIELIAGEDGLCEGDEVTIRYGFQGNEQLLWLYGFVEENNVHDQAVLQLFDKSDPRALNKQLVLNEMGQAAHVTFGWEEVKDPSKIIQWARICCLSDVEVESWNKVMELLAASTEGKGEDEEGGHLLSLAVLDPLHPLFLSVVIFEFDCPLSPLAEERMCNILFAMLDDRIAHLSQPLKDNGVGEGSAVSKEDHAYRLQMCTVRPPSCCTLMPVPIIHHQPIHQRLSSPEYCSLTFLQTYRKGQEKLMRALAESIQKKLGLVVPELEPRRYLGLFGPRKPWSEHGVRSTE
jgi:hypothetical protein